MKKLIGLTIIIAGSLIISQALLRLNGEKGESSVAPPKSSLTLAIENDLSQLSQSGKLPIEWESIREEKITGTPSIKGELIKTTRTNVVLNKTGHYRLETTMLAENPEVKNTRILVQFELFEINSENKVWETFRIYEQ